MISKTIKYYFLSSLLVATLLLPITVLNIHLVVNKHHKKDIHQHDSTSICDSDIDFCSYNNYTYIPYTLDLLKINVLIIQCTFKKLKIKYSLQIYINNSFKFIRGRSPPKNFNIIKI